VIRGLAKAKAEFDKDLKRSAVFLVIEGRIKNPAQYRSRLRSETLLAGWVVLNCGRLEKFLQDSFYAAADDWRNRIGDPGSPKLILPGQSEALEWQNIDGFMQRFARLKFLPRSDQIGEVNAFAQSLASNLIHPQSFQNTNANPNWNTLAAMFNRLRCGDLKNKLSASYADPLGRSLSGTLIESTLETFVRNRNQAAHSGRMSNFTRADAAQMNAFLLGLTTAVQATLNAHVSSVL
jgi:hypothetical protein